MHANGFVYTVPVEFITVPKGSFRLSTRTQCPGTSLNTIPEWKTRHGAQERALPREVVPGHCRVWECVWTTLYLVPVPRHWVWTSPKFAQLGLENGEFGTVSKFARFGLGDEFGTVDQNLHGSICIFGGIVQILVRFWIRPVSCKLRLDLIKKRSCKTLAEKHLRSLFYTLLLFGHLVLKWVLIHII